MALVEVTDLLAAAVAADDGRSVVHAHEPLGPFTTYRVGGPARWMVDVASQSALGAIAQVIAQENLAVLTIGLGSNLLVPDDGFDGVAVRLVGDFEQLEFDGLLMHAGAAVSLPVAARQSVGAGLTGFEWAVGVPGSIGGAVRMNAGGHGSDMAASLVSAEVLDFASGTTRVMTVSELDFAYRHSAIRSHDCVVAATLRLDAGDETTGREQLSEIVRWRREHQPGGANAGSVFVNPAGDSAGRLIDAAGCKGLRVGSAEVSTKHANFIQVDPGGSASDVLELMDSVTAMVREHAGVELEIETRVLGRNTGDTR